MPAADTPVLQDQTVYEAWDRFVCSNRHCAGAAIYLTGRTADGYWAHAVTAAFLIEWSSYAIGPLTCPVWPAPHGPGTPTVRSGSSQRRTCDDNPGEVT